MDVVTDKQEVITQRFRNITVRNAEISLLFQTAASINCYSSEYKDMVISGPTHRLLRSAMAKQELAPMQINFLRVLHLF